MIEQSNKDGASAFSLCVSHLPNQILRYWALYSSSFVIIDQAIKISPASLWFAHMLTSHNFISLSEFGTWAVPLLLVCPQLSCSNLQQVHRSEALRLKRELASLQALLASYRFFFPKLVASWSFEVTLLLGWVFVKSSTLDKYLPGDAYPAQGETESSGEQLRGEVRHLLAEVWKTQHCMDVCFTGLTCSFVVKGCKFEAKSTDAMFGWTDAHPRSHRFGWVAVLPWLGNPPVEHMCTWPGIPSRDRHLATRDWSWDT